MLTAIGRTVDGIAPALAAKRLHCSTRAVQRMCAAGKINAHQAHNGRWLVDRVWLAKELTKRAAMVIRRPAKK
jgi:hypothetical protein